MNRWMDNDGLKTPTPFRVPASLKGVGISPEADAALRCSALWYKGGRFMAAPFIIFEVSLYNAATLAKHKNLAIISQFYLK